MTLFATFFIIINIILFSGSKTYVYDAKVYVIPQKNTIGIATDKDGLNFGRVPLNYNSIKYITIHSRENYDVILTLSASGNISDFLSFEEKYVIKKGESLKVPISLNASRLGNYTGTVTISVSRKVL